AAATVPFAALVNAPLACCSASRTQRRARFALTPATTLLRQGASGYLNKECDPEEIVKAIRTVYRGRKYITAGVAELLADGLGGGSADRPAHEQLSEREFQVFLRLAKGETIGHMANSMSLSVKTVSTYRTRVMEKMKLESNSDLTYYALKNGLIQ